MKRIFNILIAVLALTFTACEKDIEIEPTLLTEENMTVTPSYHSAKLVWEATTEATIEEVALQYSTDPNFKTWDVLMMNKLEGDNRSEQRQIVHYKFEADLEISAKTTYYVRFEAYNAVGTRMSKVYSFKSKDESAPEVRTDSIVNITTSSADVYGTLVDWGSDTKPTQIGFCYGTHTKVTVEDDTVLVTVKGPKDTVITYSLKDLKDNAVYYVRTFAKNEKGLSYGEEKSFTTISGLPPTVGNITVDNISYTTAFCTSYITSNGNIPIQERGFCYSTSPNPTVDNQIAIATDFYIIDNIENFYCIIEGLSDGTKYYIRSFAKNNQGIGYGEPVEFTTMEYSVPTLTLEISNVGCTEATCKGAIKENGGLPITECGICYSTSPNPTIADNKIEHPNSADLEFVCKITDLALGNTYYVRAYAVNNVGVGYGEGMKIVPGAFNVSATKQVLFSKGNLQYNAMEGSHICADGTLKPGTWRFAENQYDIIGDDNENIASDYNGWIDLFCWGTSGWNSGATNYQPWSRSGSNSDYYLGGAYGYENNMTGNFVYADWGVYNAISNGGNEPELWRTLTVEEWDYLLERRENFAELQGAATINGLPGFIILPNGFVVPKGLLFVPKGKCTNNVYTINQWKQMEEAGAVFLPAAGWGFPVNVSGVSAGNSGNYWSSSAAKQNSTSGYNQGCGAAGIYFYPTNGGDMGIDSYDGSPRGHLHSVRLVQDVK